MHAAGQVIRGPGRSGVWITIDAGQRVRSSAGTGLSEVAQATTAAGTRSVGEQGRLWGRRETLVRTVIRAGLVEHVRMGEVHGLRRGLPIAHVLRMWRLVGLVVARVPPGRGRVRQVAAVVLRVHPKVVVVVGHHLGHTHCIYCFSTLN